MSSNRRNFIKNTTIAAAALGVAPAVFSACASPSEKINVALVGCRSMGFSNLVSFLKKGNNVECVALCDVDSKILEEKAAAVEGQTGKKPLTTGDFRTILDNPDVDVVIIGTPDHWHAVIMMLAMEAGKHVYVEKPMGHSIEECNAMVAMQQKHPDLYCQVGMWQRSSKHWYEASEVVQSGLLGDVKLVKAWVYKGYDTPYPLLEDTEAPDYVDYDMWLGPAPKRAFNWNRFHYNHRWWWDYAGGAMTDWGVHLLDFATYAMKSDMPKSITPGGGIYYHEDGVMDTPDIQQAIYDYGDHCMMWECGLNPGLGPYQKGHGVAFVGHKGTLVLTRGGYEIISDRNDKEKKPHIEEKVQKNYGDGLDQHVVNMLDCIRKGGKLNTPVEVGAKVATISEMGNMAFRAGTKLHWNNDTKTFKEDIGNQLSKVTYRDKWQLPKV